MKPKRLERDDSMLSQISDITLCFGCDEESRICNNDDYTPEEDNPPDFNSDRLRGLRRTFSASAKLDILRRPLSYNEYVETAASAHSVPENIDYLPSCSSNDSEMYWQKFEHDLMLNKTADNSDEILENQLHINTIGKHQTFRPMEEYRPFRPIGNVEGPTTTMKDAEVYGDSSKRLNEMNTSDEENQFDVMTRK